MRNKISTKENGFFSEKKKLVDVINVVDFLQKFNTRIFILLVRN